MPQKYINNVDEDCKLNLSDCPQILTVAWLTYKQQKGVCELFIAKYFFSESEFCTNTSITFHCN